MPNAKPLRVVHTSDVHLGAYDGYGEGWTSRRSLQEASFTRVVDLANAEDADVLIVAGDFFDNDRLMGETVEFAGSEVNRFKGRTYVVPGNHDPMDDKRVYWRYDLEAMAPRLSIVRQHQGHLFEDPEHDLVVWGRAFLETDWHFKPLEGIPERLDDRWHIALAHGHFVPMGGETHRSLPIREHEIADAAGHWDYMAFGHWEPHADVSSGGVTAIYSGAPLALSDSNTKAGWAAIVDFTDNGVSWRLSRVDPREAASAK
jgi:DNA repair exonuclease SbcCD nuclease subunit